MYTVKECASDALAIIRPDSLTLAVFNDIDCEMLEGVCAELNTLADCVHNAMLLRSLIQTLIPVLDGHCPDVSIHTAVLIRKLADALIPEFPKADT